MSSDVEMSSAMDHGYLGGHGEFRFRSKYYATLCNASSTLINVLYPANRIVAI